MNVSDIVMFYDDQFGKHRFWEIQAICLGAEGQEGVIELRSLSESPGRGADGTIHDTTFVPEPLLRSATIYTPAIRKKKAA